MQRLAAQSWLLFRRLLLAYQRRESTSPTADELQQIGDVASQAEGGGTRSDSVLVTSAEPRLKLSVLLDTALNSELARPPQAEVLEVHAFYVELRGAVSSEDIEPSLSSSSESEVHNSWNPVLGLCCHYHVEPICEQISH